MDVLTAALTIAKHYDLLDDLAARVETSIQLSVADGHLTVEEASPQA